MIDTEPRPFQIIRAFAIGIAFGLAAISGTIKLSLLIYERLN